MSDFSRALDSINLKITKYDKSKPRGIGTDRTTAISIEGLSKLVKDLLGAKIVEFPALYKALFDTGEMIRLLEAYVEEFNIFTPVEKSPVDMSQFEGLVLNCDISSSSRDDRFFVTNSNETFHRMNGTTYLEALGIKGIDAYSMARKVVKEYMPGKPLGVSTRAEKRQGDVEYQIFNTYMPPNWTNEKVSKDSLPKLFEKLVNHIFPIPLEREYFFHWLHASVFSRAQVYLVLCGAPGVGKNTLKAVMRALHGHSNTVDGKRSTLTERFNSQLSDCTLVWFDELKYDQEMENNLKELPSDTVSVEKKGVDASRSTKIYASFVISNNKPRDNYLDFNARKFAPLQLNDKRLEESMTSDEIDLLVAKVQDEDKETFDPQFLAQIARWIKKNGKSRKWPNLEYRGPMFYYLTHTSMSRWQRKAADLVLNSEPRSTAKIIYDEKLGFKWSTLQMKASAKHGDNSLKFPGDYSSVKDFFNLYLDRSGKKLFTTADTDDAEITNDFWVKAKTKGKEENGKGKEKSTKDRDYLDL